MNAILFHVRRTLAWFCCAGSLCAATTFAASDDGDNFDDNSKNAKWGRDSVVRRGVLTERNQRLEYTCSDPTFEDQSLRPWVLTGFPYNMDWEVRVDVFNGVVPQLDEQVTSLGFDILTTGNPNHGLFAELYSSALGGLPSRTGFYSELETDDEPVSVVDREGGNGVTNGAIRIAFNSSSKVITIFYDIDVSNSYQWVEQASFGLAGAGGADFTTDWGLNDTHQFAVFLYGYSSIIAVPTGKMHLDNFVAINGVTPSGGPTPDPLGSFDFSFPTNNPLLTRIVSLTGNYQGVTPTSFARNYSIDVAQDESGKLAFMGNMDGIQDKNGNTEISAGGGAVKTVNGTPTVQIGGAFTGTRDGASTTFNGKSTTPAELVDFGGQPGVSGIATYKSKVGGVPFSGKNVPVQILSPPGATENLKQDWSLHLDISRKLIKGKERTVAGAQLTLPNGDTIVFPEKVTRYSAAKGYSLSFKRGTNTTVNPTRIDTKSSISIKGMTLEQQGPDAQPTGGTIVYQFLGQKGTANLTDFLTVSERRPQPRYL
ncbi:MAG TPA: hypothetical protein VNT99_12945 [Methylomirabilota bacterium]|nr:hypothetical protein [Methylomirabilota bacterium]